MKTPNRNPKSDLLHMIKQNRTDIDSLLNSVSYDSAKIILGINYIINKTGITSGQNKNCDYLEINDVPVNLWERDNVFFIAAGNYALYKDLTINDSCYIIGENKNKVFINFGNFKLTIDGNPIGYTRLESTGADSIQFANKLVTVTGIATTFTNAQPGWLIYGAESDFHGIIDTITNNTSLNMIDKYYGYWGFINSKYFIIPFKENFVISNITITGGKDCLYIKYWKEFVLDNVDFKYNNPTGNFVAILNISDCFRFYLNSVRFVDNYNPTTLTTGLHGIYINRCGDGIFTDLDYLNNANYNNNLNYLGNCMVFDERSYNCITKGLTATSNGAYGVPVLMMYGFYHVFYNITMHANWADFGHGGIYVVAINGRNVFFNIFSFNNKDNSSFTNTMRANDNTYTKVFSASAKNTVGGPEFWFGVNTWSYNIDTN